MDLVVFRGEAGHRGADVVDLSVDASGSVSRGTTLPPATVEKVHSGEGVVRRRSPLASIVLFECSAAFPSLCSFLGPESAPRGSKKIGGVPTRNRRLASPGRTG